jgi:TPR repeat protein
MSNWRITTVLVFFLAAFMSAPLSIAAASGDHVSLKTLMKAAEQGDAKAQDNLGIMYHEGQGVPQDDSQALDWYRKAAEQGYAKAQLNLGFMYYNGQGVPINYVEAFKWTALAKAGAVPGSKLYGVLDEFLNVIARNMTQWQIAQAQSEATKWSEKHLSKN